MSDAPDEGRLLGPDLVGYRLQAREPVGFIELMWALPGTLRGTRVAMGPASQAGGNLGATNGKQRGRRCVFC